MCLILWWPKEENYQNGVLVCSNQGVFVGYDSQFASSVGLILNKEKRTVTPQFHVVYDDWFTTTYSDGPDPPPEWALLFEHSCENYLDPGPDNSDGAVLVPDPSPDWMSEIRCLERLGTVSPPARQSVRPVAPTLLVEPPWQATSPTVVAPLPSPAAATPDLLSDSVVSSLPNS